MRHMFGGELHQLVVQPDVSNGGALVPAPGGTPLPPLFVIKGGATPVTDFLVWGGSAYDVPATAVLCDEDGYPPAFLGPDGVQVLYDSKGRELRSRTVITPELLPAGTVMRVYKSGSAWPPRPTTRPDIIVDWRGDAPGPDNALDTDEWEDH